ncbi:MAG: hypothetical protein DI527_23390 [Chelatococcus sp.]|nr:MAG: hypothetical protein DI527_23390 [Chelatococcus sp.]
MVKPSHLDHLRRRQKQAHAAVLRAERSRRGGIGEARRDFILATAELLRATLQADRPAKQPKPQPAGQTLLDLGA